MARTDQVNSGSRQKDMPGARMVKTVVTKLTAPIMDEAPSRMTLIAHSVCPSGPETDKGT